MCKKATFLIFIPLIFSCASVHRKPKEPQLQEPQVGIASWYGPEEHGGPTASGERFNMYDFTAAHRTLPFGTKVKVTNLENGRKVGVRINDRGPFKRSRIIDLSYAAAKSIRMIGKGTARVRLEVLSADGDRISYSHASYTVQVGAFKSRENAHNLKEELRTRAKDVRVEPYGLDGEVYHRVRVGRFSKREDAEKLAGRLRGIGYWGMVVSE